jgi:hypothetical protein
MESNTTLLRRYIDLFESCTVAVKVTIERYVGIDQTPSDGSPFPASFTFQANPAYNGDAISRAIRAEVQTATGYEPAKFKWAWAPASPEEMRAISSARDASGES